MTHLPPDDDSAWLPWREQWKPRSDTLYLNHGSFGLSPEPVRSARRRWIDRLDEQPMDFFLRQYEDHLLDARTALAELVGVDTQDLIFVENATAGMNVLAGSMPLAPGDEVLLTDHEYGAVERVWDRACKWAGAHRVTVELPERFTSPEEIVETVLAAVTERTKLIVISQITSPTAVILPVEQICARARQRGVRVCIDGPHAVAMLPLRLAAMDCDYFTASCHKWLSAPFGAGFLYVHPRVQNEIKPLAMSWGRNRPKPLEIWRDEFTWSGTRDPSPYLSIPAAIDFLKSVGLESFRARTHFLASQARERLVELTGLEPYLPDSPAWYGSMIPVPLPPGDAAKLQEALWQRYGIEVPVIAWKDNRHIRVSCHLYNTLEDLDRLIVALRALLAEGL